MKMKLDPKGLEAAYETLGMPDHPDQRRPIEPAITAYLSAITPAEAGGLVRRLQALQEHLQHQPLTHADAVDIETIGEAASALAAERDAHAETKRERDDLKDEWQAEFESRVEANTALRMTKARLAEALKALAELIELNDSHSPFGGGLYQDRIDRTWEAARRVREGGKNG